MLTLPSCPAAAGPVDCPAALDFHRQPLTGDKPVHRGESIHAQVEEDFCRLTCGVQFPMFAWTRVPGPVAESFYRYLADVAGDVTLEFSRLPACQGGRVAASFPGQVGPDAERLNMTIVTLFQVRS